MKNDESDWSVDGAFKLVAHRTEIQFTFLYDHQQFPSIWGLPKRHVFVQSLAAE
ncbi:TBP associated factor [Aspergillus luchuensis]|uniref:TBP associated factor n=1 Tax=Aspergillus kawachii TaxID=1069201 RepID=A0A146FRW1_ASPKA|nr:TBP associated factor [Aspergillus luchuensis]